jgi:hypothetical protein
MGKLDSLDGAIGMAVETTITHYTDLAKDKLTLAEVGGLLTSAAASFLRIFKDANGLGADTKETILEILGVLFDRIAPRVDIPWVPEVIESRVVDPKLRKAILHFADGAIDSLIGIFNRTGWVDVVPGVNGTPAAPAGETPPVIPGTERLTAFTPY